MATNYGRKMYTRVDEDTYKYLKHTSKENGIAISEFIRQLIFKTKLEREEGYILEKHIFKIEYRLNILENFMKERKKNNNEN